MKRQIAGLALLGAAMFVTAGPALGFGKKKAPCGPAPCASSTGDCGISAPRTNYAVSYVDQVVQVNEWVSVPETYTYWESVPTTAKQKVTVKESAWKEEAYKYTVNELVSAKEKVRVKQQTWKEEAYKYTANEWVTAKEKVKVAETRPVTKEVEVTTYSHVPVVTKQKRTVCEYVSVPEVVTCAAPAPVYAHSCGSSGRGGLCGKKKGCNDCAPPCPAPCDAGCAPTVTYTVMRQHPVHREIEVDVTTYQRVENKEKRQVTTHEIAWVEKDVDVRKSVPVEKTGTRQVPHWVDVEQEVTVTKAVPVEKTGTRKVPHWVDVEQEVTVAKYVPVEKTGTRQVPHWVDVEQEVTVSKYVPVEKTATRKVHHWVDVTKDVDVTTWAKVERTGTRNVMKCVPTEKVVKVPVYTPVPTAPDCGSPCGPVGPAPCAPAPSCGTCSHGCR